MTCYIVFVICQRLLLNINELFFKVSEKAISLGGTSA